MDVGALSRVMKFCGRWRTLEEHVKLIPVGEHLIGRALRKWDTAWRALREPAALPGLRFYDLRHTVITELCEMGVPEETIMAIAGHFTRRMLEHYSHIRIAAKGKALDDLDRLREEQPQPEAEQGQVQ